jgi:hypothetical protein
MSDQGSPTPQVRDDDRPRKDDASEREQQAAADNRPKLDNPESDHPAWDNPGRAGVSNSGG